jgi:Nucleotidyl transferase AbiEii toxin, Type IV TA system
MISRRELEQLRAEWTLDITVIEKDYLLGWLLAGIAAHPALSRTWVFKGGTCLRKCYYETFRFSEDLDFTAYPAVPTIQTTCARCSARSPSGCARNPASSSPSTARRSGGGRTSAANPPLRDASPTAARTPSTCSPR